MKGLSKYVTHLEDFHPDDDAIFCPFCEKLGFPARKELRRHVILEHKVMTVPVIDTSSNVVTDVFENYLLILFL